MDTTSSGAGFSASVFIPIDKDEDGAPNGSLLLQLKTVTNIQFIKFFLTFERTSDVVTLYTKVVVLDQMLNFVAKTFLFQITQTLEYSIQNSQKLTKWIEFYTWS